MIFEELSSWVFRICMVIRVCEASEQWYWSSLKLFPIQFACPGQSDRSLYQTIKLLQTTNYSTKLSLFMSICLWNHCGQSDLTSLGFVSPEQKDRAALQIIKTNWTKLTWPVTSSSLDVLGKKTDNCGQTVGRTSCNLRCNSSSLYCILHSCTL